MTRRKTDFQRLIEPIARFGYASRGVVYFIIGGLALLQAFGAGGDKTDSKGALEKLMNLPFGIALVWLISLGLCSYASWRFMQSAFNADNHDKDLKGVVVRVALLFSCLTHFTLAYYAIVIATKLGSSSGGDSKEGLVAKVLGLPFGPYIVFAIALIVGAVGAAHFTKAYKQSYQKWLDLDSSKSKFLNPICRYGLVARGFVFFVIAALIGTAALTQDPDDAGGMQDVLETLQEQPYGSYLLGATAVGLLLFSAYSFIEASARKIDHNQSP